jgi:GAF domain-containing protein
MAQRHLQPHNDENLVALGRTLQTLREEENADVLIETTLDYLTQEFNYQLIWIGLYDRLEHRLFGKGGITPTGDTSFLRQWFNLHPGDVLEQAVIEQRPIGIPDLQQEVRAGEWRRAAQEFNIQGTLLFPLRCKDRCFGVVLLGSHLWGISPHPGQKAQLSLVLGGLAAALHQIEVEWQRTSAKRPDQPLFQVLNELMQVSNVEKRLEAIIRMTQQFVAPTRTNLYWYSPGERYFWHRLGNRQAMLKLGSSRTNAPGLMVAEVNDFYQALAADQLVTIGAGRSLLKSSSTERLLRRLRTRSMLAAPIRIQGELVGFLAVEDGEARIWEEAETNYVRAMAQLVALVVDAEHLETRLEEAHQNTQFGAEIAQVIRNATTPLDGGNTDITPVLRDCARLLCSRIEVERFLVLQEDDGGHYELVFGTQPLNRRPLPSVLPPLTPDERQWLVNSSEPLMIEDLELDRRLWEWREILNPLNVRSMLLVPIRQSFSSGSTISMNDSGQAERLCLIMVAQSTPRTWQPIQRDLVNIIAQQLHLLLLLGQYHQHSTQLLIAHQTLQTGLSTLLQSPLDPVQSERAWLNYLANLLDCPLVALISWTPESETATVAATVVNDPLFALSPDLSIPLASDSLILETLSSSNFICYSVADLTASTREWLNCPGMGQILAIALYTDATPATGILLCADREERQWPTHLLPVLETLTQQFTWLRHYQYSLDEHTQGIKDLQSLNWYKHRCLELLHQSVRQGVSTLLELDAKMLPPFNSGEVPSSHPSDGDEPHVRDPSQGQSLRQTHRQQILHQLEQTLAVLTPVLKDEQWQLTNKPQTLPLAGMLKRSLHRVEPLYKQHQLRLQVQNVGNKSVYGDRLKLECLLFELLMTFGIHAQRGSWINLWCSPFPSESQPPPHLELLIAQSASLDECLSALTSVSPLPPNSLNLQICQQILHSWGGELQFYPLDRETALQEPRCVGRLILPGEFKSVEF